MNPTVPPPPDGPRTTITRDGVCRVYAADGRQLEGPAWNGPKPWHHTAFRPGECISEHGGSRADHEALSWVIA